jgi:hypothetical protein
VVANTLDRLRALTGATNVELGSSSRAQTSSSATSRKPTLVGGGGSTGGCDDASGHVAFDATVTLTAPGPSEAAQPTTSTTPTAAGTETGT